jgi:transposase
MGRFVEGLDRSQTTLFPECLDDWIDEDNPVRVIDAFVDSIDLGELGFDGVVPEATGRPAYHPSVLLKLYVYGYLNRVQSSRRLEREAGRNVEVMWLTGRLVPDHKTIADFRKDNGRAIRKVCTRFVGLCREMGLLSSASVAIDGSKFKAVNNRDRNFTRAKMARRRAQIEESVTRYLQQLDTADRQEPSDALATKTTRLREKIAKLGDEMRRLAGIEARMLANPDQQVSLTDPDARSMATSGRGSGVVGYNVQVAVETEHHLIVAHEVTNVGSDRSQLAAMAKEAKAILRAEARCRRRSRLLQQRGNSGLRASGDHSNAAQADDVRRKGRRTVRQTGLRLPAGGRRLSLPGRRDLEVPLHERRKRSEATSLLDQRLPELPDQAPLHASQRAPNHALGA